MVTRNKSPEVSTEACLGVPQAEAKAGLTFTECLHIAVHPLDTLSHFFLTVALDKELRLREVKDAGPGHTAKYMSEVGIKPGLLSSRPGNENIKILHPPTSLFWHCNFPLTFA